MYALYPQSLTRRVRISAPKSYCLFTYTLVHHFLSDQTANMRRYMARALMAPAMGTVPTQARMMFLKSFQSTFCLDLTRPTDTTEPTLQWVVLIGIPTLDARRTVKAEPTSMQNPLKTKHNFVIIN